MKHLTLNISTKKLRKIKGKMKELDITNRSIARKVGVSDAMVSMVLGGSVKSKRVLDAVVHALSSCS
jgi:predicted transcriptional regulator